MSLMRKKKRVKNYEPVVDAELDLHGYFVDEARREALAFLDEAREHGWSRVRIIVGKGTHSPDGKGVLPDMVKNVLHQRSLTYTYAKLAEGGEGALEVRV